MASLPGLLLDHFEADHLPGGQSGGCAVLVPQPERERGGIDHLLGFLPVLQFGAPFVVADRVDEGALALERAQGLERRRGRTALRHPR
ncbi:MAG: hypothetical protein WKF47_00065 [Geodermatophilaceae bacterium]